LKIFHADLEKGKKQEQKKDRQQKQYMFQKCIYKLNALIRSLQSMNKYMARALQPVCILLYYLFCGAFSFPTGLVFFFFWFLHFQVTQ